MTKNETIDIEWLENLADKLFSIEDTEKRKQFLRSQEIMLTHKQEIRTVRDVANMQYHIIQIKTVLLDKELDEGRRSTFISFAVRELIDSKLPTAFTVDVVNAVAEYECLDNPDYHNEKSLCDILDRIAEKYTPSKADLRKNTLLDDLARGTSKIIVTDEKADDELNW